MKSNSVQFFWGTSGIKMPFLDMKIAALSGDVIEKNLRLNKIQV
jgi:hypothetical protein